LFILLRRLDVCRVEAWGATERSDACGDWHIHALLYLNSPHHAGREFVFQGDRRCDLATAL